MQPFESDMFNLAKCIYSLSVLTKSIARSFLSLNTIVSYGYNSPKSVQAATAKYHRVT